jgi:hypothetical protein
MPRAAPVVLAYTVKAVQALKAEKTRVCGRKSERLKVARLLFVRMERGAKLRAVICFWMAACAAASSV